MVRRIGIFVVGATVLACAFDLGQRFMGPVAQIFVVKVEAVVGRPLTPVSISGVARRTSRRCRADVYDC